MLLSMLFFTLHYINEQSYKVPYTPVSKRIGDFINKVKNLHLFFQINFILFKVIPFQHNTIMLTSFEFTK